MPKPEVTQVGRVAFRVEGEWWNAYYAMPDTMEGAIFLCSIRFGAVAENRARKRAFMDLARGMVSDIIAGKTGHTPTWGGPVTAPESERAGNA